MSKNHSTSSETLKQALLNHAKQQLHKALRRTLSTQIRSEHGRALIKNTDKELDRISGRIKRYLTNRTDEFKASRLSVPMLKEKHAKEIYGYIEAQTTLCYILGLKYVQHGINKTPDLSALEEHKIKLLAKRYSDSFWKNLIKSQDEVLNIKGASFFDFIQSLARMITFHSVNDATVQFGMQLSAGLYPGTNASEPLFEFCTKRDERVDCRICAPLDGILMRPSDPEWAQPPLHYGCRCRVLLHVNGETIGLQAFLDS